MEVKPVRRPLVSIKEASQLIARKPTWLRKMNRTGELPDGICYRIGNLLVFDDEKLIAWIESGGAARPSQRYKK